MLISTSWAIRCAAFLMAMVPCLSIDAQDAATRSASVEELTTMLKSIDPYNPDSEITGEVKIFGSTSMDGLAHGWASGFKHFHAKAVVEVSASGSETFNQLLAQPDGIAMLSRPVKQEELDQLKQRGLKAPTAFVVAREALAVFVHSSNPVQTISGEQLRTIFTTDVTPGDVTWKALGGSGAWANQPIHVVARTPNSGTQKFLTDFVFRSSTIRAGVSEHESNAQVLQMVSQDPYAIAICGLKSSGKSVKSLQLTAGATVISSDDHAVLTGQYPLTRPMSVVLDLGQTSQNAKASQELVHYALCQAGQSQAIVAGLYPVDLPLLRAGLQRLGAAHVR